MRLSGPNRGTLPRTELRSLRLVIGPESDEASRRIVTDVAHSIERLAALREERTRIIDIDCMVQKAVLREPQLTLLMKTRLIRPHHLFLIHRQAEGDHLASLFESLVTSASHMGLQVEAYTFGNKPTMFFQSQRPSGFFTLDDLGRLHANDRLFVVGEASLFFDHAGQLEKWVPTFSSWRERAILTPTPQAAWGHTDAVLASEGFLVVPTTSTGIDAISREWAQDQVLENARTPMPGGGISHPAPLFPPLLAPEKIHLVSASRPHRSHLKALREQLTEYLASDIAWLSACAVYPQLHWNLTLRLGTALAGEGVIPELTLDRVALLATLPWFRAGSMPDALRSHLLETLPKELQDVVRRAVERILWTAMMHSGEPGAQMIEVRTGRPGIMERLRNLFVRE